MRITLATLVATGCVAPPDLGAGTGVDADLADATLADVLPLLYRDAEGTPERVGALVEALERRVHEEGVPLDGPRKAREFALAPLPHDRLGGVPPPPGTAPEAQSSVVVFSRGRHGLDGMISVQRERNHVCIESKTTVYYARTFTTDDGCLQARTCDVARSVAEVRKELSILDAGWYDFHKDFRLAALDDGREVLVARGWLPEARALERGGSASQTFTIEVWLEEGDVTLRAYALWGELRFGGLGPAAVMDLTADAMHENQERQDLFLDGEPLAAWCGQDRARVYDRPDPG